VSEQRSASTSRPTEGGEGGLNVAMLKSPVTESLGIQVRRSVLREKLRDARSESITSKNGDPVAGTAEHISRSIASSEGKRTVTLSGLLNSAIRRGTK